MRVLSLFSGIGLHDLGLTWAGMEIVGQCEIDPFASAVLEKWWPSVHRWKNVKDVTLESIRAKCGRIDLITGGWPCTDISVAGRGEGIGTAESPTDRSGLFWELLRIIRGVRPHWLVLENVPRLRTLGADIAISELEAIGYTCWPLVVGASDVGLPHERKRVWIVCHLADAASVSERESTDEAYAEPTGGVPWLESVYGSESPSPIPLAVPSCTGLAERWGLPLGPRPEESLFACGGRSSVPMPPSPYQWDWEPSRTVEFKVDRNASRRLRKLVRPLDDNALEAFPLSPTQVKVLEKWANEEALKCYGNANPPYAIEAIGRAILKIESGAAV